MKSSDKAELKKINVSISRLKEMIKRDLIQNDSKLLEAQKQCGMKSNGESK
jgi:hypothetical protein